MELFVADFWHWWMLAVALVILEIFAPTFFALWLGAMDHLTEFLDFINTLDEKLKFTMEFGGYTICFIDLNKCLQNKNN